MNHEIRKRNPLVASTSAIAEQNIFHALPSSAVRDAFVRFEAISISTTRAEFTLRFIFATVVFAIGMTLLVLGSFAVPELPLYTTHILAGTFQIVLALAWYTLTFIVMCSSDIEGAMRRTEVHWPIFRYLLPATKFNYMVAADLLAVYNGLNGAFTAVVDYCMNVPGGLKNIPNPGPAPAQGFNYALITLAVLALVLPRITEFAMCGNRMLSYLGSCRRPKAQCDPVDADLKRFVRLTRENIDIQWGVSGTARVVNARYRLRLVSVKYTRDTFQPVEFFAGGYPDGESGSGAAANGFKKQLAGFEVNPKNGGSLARAVITSTNHSLLLNVYEDVHPRLVARFVRLLHERIQGNGVAWQKSIPALQYAYAPKME